MLVSPEGSGTTPDATLLRRFDEDGVIQLPGFLDARLLEVLRTQVGDLLNRLQRLLPRTDLDVGPPGVGTIAMGASRTIIRVDGLVEANTLPSVLSLLGSPPLESLAKALADDAIITQVDLVVRQRGDGQLIAWHQDAVFTRTHRYAALGFALDNTAEGDGDLLTLPGSQQTVQDICAIEDAHGFEPPGLRRITPLAGDLVIHDVMLVHGSLPLTERLERRTLYVYVDSVARILESEPDSAAWVGWRQGLWGSAREAWQAFSAGDPAWRESRWPAGLQGPPRVKPMTLAGNYCVRQGGVAVGNTSDFFLRRS